MLSHIRYVVVVIFLPLSFACVQNPQNIAAGTGKATILGKVVASKNARELSAIGTCPVVAVTVNGTPVSIDFDDDCSFAITDVQAGPLVEVRVELVDLGIAGTVELKDVLDGELIEIVVEPSDNSLTIFVERRVVPKPSGDLPELIQDNNVSILLPAGVFDQDLTVQGNNFTLFGQAGDSCDDQTGWTVITGKVVVDGNNATFRNILFEGPIELHGNNTRFINSCIGDQLLVFGKMKGQGQGNNNNSGNEDENDGKHDNKNDDD